MGTLDGYRNLPELDDEQALRLIERAQRSGVTVDGKLTFAGQDLWAALWPYGFKTVQALLRDGDMVSRLMSLKVNTRALDNISPSTWEMLEQRADVREQLASEMSLLAWPRFAEKVVFDDYWHPDQSRLTTLWV